MAGCILCSGNAQTSRCANQRFHLPTIKKARCFLCQLSCPSPPCVSPDLSSPEFKWLRRTLSRLPENLGVAESQPVKQSKRPRIYVDQQILQRNINCAIMADQENMRVHDSPRQMYVKTNPALLQMDMTDPRLWYSSLLEKQMEMMHKNGKMSKSASQQHVGKADLYFSLPPIDKDDKKRSKSGPVLTEKRHSKKSKKMQSTSAMNGAIDYVDNAPKRRPSWRNANTSDENETSDSGFLPPINYAFGPNNPGSDSRGSYSQGENGFLSSSDSPLFTSASPSKPDPLDDFLLNASADSLDYAQRQVKREQLKKHLYSEMTRLKKEHEKKYHPNDTPRKRPMFEVKEISPRTEKYKALRLPKSKAEQTNAAHFRQSYMLRQKSALKLSLGGTRACQSPNGSRLMHIHIWDNGGNKKVNPPSDTRKPRKNSSHPQPVVPNNTVVDKDQWTLWLDATSMTPVQKIPDGPKDSPLVTKPIEKDSLASDDPNSETLRQETQTNTNGTVTTPVSKVKSSVKTSQASIVDLYLQKKDKRTAGAAEVQPESVEVKPHVVTVEIKPGVPKGKTVKPVVEPSQSEDVDVKQENTPDEATKAVLLKYTNLHLFNDSQKTTQQAGEEEETARTQGEIKQLTVHRPPLYKMDLHAESASKEVAPSGVNKVRFERDGIAKAPQKSVSTIDVGRIKLPPLNSSAPRVMLYNELVQKAQRVVPEDGKTSGDTSQAAKDSLGAVQKANGISPKPDCTQKDGNVASKSVKFETKVSDCTNSNPSAETQEVNPQTKPVENGELVTNSNINGQQ